MSHFQLAEKRLRPDCREIQVAGEVDLAVADQLDAALERAAAYDRVLIDLQRCEFIDSTAIAVILRAHEQMAARGRRVALYGASGQVRRILSITGLTENGLVAESADDALSTSA